ncbi:hypothetical protein JOB18_029380 [Solea senegalensis]|uniref:Uncharacterized protein n=1 Tax=Solea senegalensis TaxID=28829 RepID=A0AAV6T8E8_SOLSE|nr:hypothetical protein JOB18_029380 [Solea senegalensis]
MFVFQKHHNSFHCFADIVQIYLPLRRKGEEKEMRQEPRKHCMKVAWGDCDGFYWLENCVMSLEFDTSVVKLVRFVTAENECHELQVQFEFVEEYKRRVFH